MPSFANREEYERWKAQETAPHPVAPAPAREPLPAIEGLHLVQRPEPPGAPRIALASCPACTKAVSPAAVTCPRCGHPFEEYERWRAQSGIVTDVRMPFLSMVEFMVKWSLAVIPAVIILAFIWVFSFGFLGAFFAALSKQ